MDFRFSPVDCGHVNTVQTLEGFFWPPFLYYVVCHSHLLLLWRWRRRLFRRRSRGVAVSVWEVKRGHWTGLGRRGRSRGLRMRMGLMLEERETRGDLLQYVNREPGNASYKQTRSNLLHCLWVLLHTSGNKVRGGYTRPNLVTLWSTLGDVNEGLINKIRVLISLNAVTNCSVRACNFSYCSYCYCCTHGRCCVCSQPSYCATLFL